MLLYVFLLYCLVDKTGGTTATTATATATTATATAASGATESRWRVVFWWRRAGHSSSGNCLPSDCTVWFCRFALDHKMYEANDICYCFHVKIVYSNDIICSGIRPPGAWLPWCHLLFSWLCTCSICLYSSLLPTLSITGFVIAHLCCLPPYYKQFMFFL